MGHRTIAERCGDVGTRFVPLSQGELWNAMDDPGDFEAEIRLLIDELCFSSTIPGDLTKELDREPADAVLVDCMLSAIDVALASGSPTAALFHTAYTIFRGGPLVEMFAPGMAIANGHRAELGLPAVERLGDIHDACACAIVERHRDDRTVDRSGVRDPGANTQVARYVPHAEILPSASLVITHAGFRTTMAALGHGVPLFTPLGRDQHFNAERV
jgi:hypothetical protein